MTISNLPVLTKPRLLPQGAGQFFRQRVAELVGLVMLLAGIAGLLALASFDRGDPSYNLATPQAPANIFGRPGAYAADIVLQSIGLAGYVLMLVLAVWGLLLMRRHSVPRLALRLAILPLALLLWAVAANFLAGEGSLWISHAGPGGITGRELGQLAAAYGGRFALGGSSVALIAAGLALFTTISTLAMRGRDWPLLIRVLIKTVGGIWRGLRFVVASLTGLARSGRQRAADLGAAAGARFAERVEPTLAHSLGDGPQVYGTDPLDQPDDQSAASRRYDDDQRDDREIDPDGVEYIQPDPVRVLERAPSAADVRALPISIVSQPNRDQSGRDHAGPREIVLPRAPAPQPGRRAQRASQLDLRLDKFAVPALDHLIVPPRSVANLVIDEEALAQNARLLESVLAEFGVKGEIVKVRPGPVVTLYELEPAPGTKSSRVINLADDIARSMSAVSVRVATVPGRNVIGIELPNQRRETVYLRELLASKDYEDTRLSLPLVLGKDIGGSPVVADLARMPHLLIGGTTGSGKSVAINTMILSLLYRLTPDKCRFIMIDPKMLELSVYADIPHLLTPVVTEPRKAVVALKWVVREMENRYRAMSQLGVRNIAGYNERVAEARRKGEIVTRTVQIGTDPQTGRPMFEEQPLELESLPFIVVIVDEMADLMLVAGKDIEAAIQRLAQMARAAGIHLIMATQRPSVDVITGTIKANFPTRISFQVTSKIDSRTILGEQGGEQLLGQGDMLYMAGGGRISRVHAPFVTETEVEKVVKFLRSQGDPLYVTGVIEEQPGAGASGAIDGGEGGEGGDDLYDQAVAIITRERKASTSFIQRHLQIGYNRAARIIERMEAEGVVSPANHVGKREVLARDIDDNERLN